jgi:hypothetical protein
MHMSCCSVSCQTSELSGATTTIITVFTCFTNAAWQAHVMTELLQCQLSDFRAVWCYNGAYMFYIHSLAGARYD